MSRGQNTQKPSAPHAIKGKVTGDRGEETKGKARQAVGNLRRTARDVKEDLR